LNPEKKRLYLLSNPVKLSNGTIVIGGVWDDVHIIDLKDNYIKLTGVCEYYSLGNNLISIKHNGMLDVYDLTEF